jgi:hypothetical protein
MSRRPLELLGLCLAILLSAATSLFGQAGDRAVITGLVTDPSGAAIAGAKVTATNEQTSVKINVASDSAGAYETPPMILGTYSLLVEKEGFKSFLRSGIVLAGGVRFRLDVTLELGVVTQTVEVKGATEMINTQTPEVSHTLGERYYTDLPAVMGADIRLAESLLQVQPGYIPLAPNGDAMFRGSQFQSRINGGQTMSTENWFDGAAFGYAEGHQQTQESSLPYDSIKEMKVILNQFSAQYGYTSGGVIQYVTKSGTNQFHGDIYDYLLTSKQNARVFFSPDILPLTQNNLGAAIGGPVYIPKVYNGKGKSFFFTNIDWLNYKSIVNTGFVNYLPSIAERGGDFSEFLDTSTTVGTDALGRPIYKGEIYNPATTRTTPEGIPVRDGYGFDVDTGAPLSNANIIPLGTDPLTSSIASKIVPLIQPLDRNVSPAVAPNGFGGFSDDNNIISVKTWLLRIDHTISDKFQASNTFYENYRPRTAHCGAPMGCNTEHNGQTDSQANDTYYGVGFFQLITNKNDHFQLSWVMKPNLFNHTTLAYDRWYMGGHSLSSGAGWPTILGTPWIIDQTAGPPGIGWGGGTTPYTGIGNSWRNGYEINNRYQFLDDITWIKGKHTVKAGWEYRFMNFPQKGWAVQTGGNYNFSANETAGYDSAGNNLSTTGDSFASFLLGQVDNAYFNTFNPYMPQMYYTSPWINDDIKVTKKLTLTIGFRGDFQSGLREQHDRFSWFDPNATQDINGDTVKGAMIFAGYGAGKANKSYNEDSKWNWGPRVGFAYSPTDKNVIRGGYGIFYGIVNADQWMGKPITGYTTTPTAPNLTNGRYPAFWWDQPATCPTTVTNMGIGCGFPAADIILPPTLSPAVANGTSPTTIQHDQNTLPRYQNWSLSFQRQLTENMMIDIDYVGNHGTRLVAPNAWVGPLGNRLLPSVLDTYTVAQLQGSPTDAGVALPYNGFTGDLAQALRPWPQYQTINYRSVPVGQSIYHAFQFLFEKRMAKEGLQFRAAYNFSKLINDGAEAGHGGQTGGQFGGNSVQNPGCIHQCERSVSVDDVPQYLGLSWIYELPFGPGKHWGAGTTGVASRLIGGWKVAATQVYMSGRPLQIAMSNDLGGLIFNNGKRPNKVGEGVNTSFKDPATDLYLMKSGWADPGAHEFGNAPRSDPHARGFPYFNEDLNFMKDTRINERSYIRFEFQAGNLFNRVDFCLPNQSWDAGAFGSVGSQCNIPRRVQWGLTLNF